MTQVNLIIQNFLQNNNLLTNFIVINRKNTLKIENMSEVRIEFHYLE